MSHPTLPHFCPPVLHCWMPAAHRTGAPPVRAAHLLSPHAHTNRGVPPTKPQPTFVSSPAPSRWSACGCACSPAPLQRSPAAAAPPVQQASWYYWMLLAGGVSCRQRFPAVAAPHTHGAYQRTGLGYNTYLICGRLAAGVAQATHKVAKSKAAFDPVTRETGFQDSHQLQ